MPLKLPYAKDGSTKAMASLAQAYHKGKGVKKNMDKAIKLYTEAASAKKKPSITAAYNLASILNERESPDVAIPWFQKAASYEIDLGNKRNVGGHS